MEKKCYFHQEIDFSDTSQLEKCMKYFSINDSLSLNFTNFKDLMANLLTDSQGKSQNVSESMLTELFDNFDVNSDDQIDITEFTNVWNNFIKPLVKPVTALLIIDIQNDFIDGSLALKNCPAKEDGKDAIPVINNLLEEHKFDVVVYSKDYHPENHISFYENLNLYELSEKNKCQNTIAPLDTVIFKGPPEMTQILWPTHCVQKSWGSELHKNLNILKDAVHICKGTNSNIDSYSAFFDNMKLSSTILNQELKARNVTHVLVCGLAFDYCVSSTALDAVELGYATVVIQDATKGIDNERKKTIQEKLKLHNCVLADSCEIENLISGNDRRLQFASIFQERIKH